MRLSEEKINYIKSKLLELAPDGHVFLFGSRVDNQLKGGDIDILFLTDDSLSKGAFRHIRRDFFKKFGWQKLDIVNLKNTATSTFKDIALTKAIRL